ncbi:flagellar biosynthetic protein FliO [Janthinobacterium agaricidamnosum]|uniref:Flagellar protein n=1 Tax=Janthinobacterium agaricidamnosum NBRC 102515 = DSM 9628 TaxID=1349767 RepID=W0V1Z8_9BURK|nr:flagellar biosynthetic protein FliO [Janthinobacterium agaricidamnosum]CDG81891.1 flagellar biosynthesis, FliO family protein [Janthinobacterium agaricidamnosum NBRC 102515 = DSM 9628]
MKPVLLKSLLALSLALGGLAYAAAPETVSAAAVSAASAATDAAAAAPVAAPPTDTPAATPAAAAPAPVQLSSNSPSAGSLLQTILALVFVLALLIGLAWFMKRYGPKPAGGNSRLRLLSSLSLGGRERIMLIEVADQWIVVGASPGRVNALATLPRQEAELALPPAPQNGLAASNFSEWLKQTIEKRNGK